MSALDDLIARDAGASQQGGLDALIASDMGGASVPSVSPAVQPAQAPQAASNWQTPGGFMMGLGDAVKGGTQSVVHGMSWLADKVAPNSQFAKDAHTAIAQMDQTNAAQNKQYADARAAAGKDGFDWARLGGQVVGTAPTMMIGPEYASLSLPGKLALGATQGVESAALTPVDNLEDGQSFGSAKAQQMALSGGLGLAGPVAAAGAKAAGGALWNVAKPVLQPGKFVGQGLAGAMTPQDAAAAAASIRSAPQFVPGSLPTTAQAGANPVLVQTEKALANSSPDFKTALLDRSIQNNNARWGVINGIAGSPLDLQNAQAARNTAVNALYNTAKGQAYTVDAPMTNLMDRPAMKTAIDRAQKLADNNNAGNILTTARVPNPMGGSALNVTTLNGNGAQAIKESLDAMLLPENTMKLSGKEIGALQDTRNAYLSWLESKSPKFQQARQTYAGMSPPINTMTAGQKLAGDLAQAAPNATNVPQITFPNFKARFGQALKGDSDVAQFGIDPAAQQALQGVQSDLQREMVSNSVRSGGSDTAYNLAANGWLARNLYGPSFNGATGIGKSAAAIGTALTGHPIAALGVFGAGDKLGKTVGSKLQGKLSSYLLDPQSLLPYLDARASTPATQAIPGPLMKGLLNYGRPAVVNGLLGGFVNTP
jgi:hypothetical protein